MLGPRLICVCVCPCICQVTCMHVWHWHSFSQPSVRCRELLQFCTSLLCDRFSAMFPFQHKKIQLWIISYTSQSETWHCPSRNPVVQWVIVIGLSWSLWRWTMLEKHAASSRHQLSLCRREQHLTWGRRTLWFPTATEQSASTVREIIKATGDWWQWLHEAQTQQEEWRTTYTSQCES